MSGTSTVSQAITDLKKGKFILVFDNEQREGETDLVIASQFATPQAIKQMRKDGGGLIFIMTSYEIAKQLQLPFLADLYSSIEDQYPVLKHLAPTDIPYDSKSSFSLYINHRKTFTGITDIDRSLTMNTFAHLIKDINNIPSKQAVNRFGKEFRSPGHVPLCIAAQNLLSGRKGHTEYIVSLLNMAGLLPAGSGCEMIGDSGKALSKQDAKTYAKKQGLTFLEGTEIQRAWNTWSP